MDIQNIRKNTEGETYAELGNNDAVSMKMNDETYEDVMNKVEDQQYNVPRDNEIVFDKEPGQIKQTYLNPSEIDLEVNKKALYSTIPENEIQGNKDGVYAYAYSDVPNRNVIDTASDAGAKENTEIEYLNDNVKCE